ncbi:universal stress protein [Alkalicoccus luteus]|uniref:Universal stress protein n=1 Tax=Alkalicoccus luteus TaxID=1237094 RepID=A0A969PXK7_9BACI|nr:universal stress protein [Alkalicoccus luteus]NJP39289.1 universal stress protein [Alkalicoccus luteus]
MFTHILVAADGSDHSFRACEKAAELASLEEDAVIELLHVELRSRSVQDELEDEKPHSPAEEQQQLFEQYKAVDIGAAQWKETVIMERENVASSIIDYTKESGADVLVIGSRGRSSLQTMVLGSVSHKVMKYVEVPVLIVK